MGWSAQPGFLGASGAAPGTYPGIRQSPWQASHQRMQPPVFGTGPAPMAIEQALPNVSPPAPAFSGASPFVEVVPAATPMDVDPPPRPVLLGSGGASRLEGMVCLPPASGSEGRDPHSRPTSQPLPQRMPSTAEPSPRRYLEPGESFGQAEAALGGVQVTEHWSRGAVPAQSLPQEPRRLSSGYVAASATQLRQGLLSGTAKPGSLSGAAAVQPPQLPGLLGVGNLPQLPASLRIKQELEDSIVGQRLFAEIEATPWPRVSPAPSAGGSASSSLSLPGAGIARMSAPQQTSASLSMAHVPSAPTVERTSAPAHPVTAVPAAGGTTPGGGGGGGGGTGGGGGAQYGVNGGSTGSLILGSYSSCGGGSDSLCSLATSTTATPSASLPLGLGSSAFDPLAEAAAAAPAAAAVVPAAAASGAPTAGSQRRPSCEPPVAMQLCLEEPPPPPSRGDLALAVKEEPQLPLKWVGSRSATGDADASAAPQVVLCARAPSGATASNSAAAAGGSSNGGKRASASGGGAAAAASGGSGHGGANEAAAQAATAKPKAADRCASNRADSQGPAATAPIPAPAPAVPAPVPASSAPSTRQPSSAEGRKRNLPAVDTGASADADAVMTHAPAEAVKIEDPMDASSPDGGGSGPSGSGAGPSASGPSGAGGGGGGGQDSLAALREVFDLPVSDAVRVLGCSASELKRRCRALGIKRWPQRKLLSLRRIAEAADADSSLTPEERQAVQERVSSNRTAILEDPNTPLQSALKTVRQAQYKQEFELRRARGGRARSHDEEEEEEGDDD
ncbi:hypothetical protein HYH03_003598 [Edaphochlamys debaryana]|uniref:RWP-RK domain-containing protein n=1 Tax=Edaphochlamys debaryana TaxID=47281 RepID=A0A836C437_9CHLO|nr:hypothetical protein HYH03_003598 [Edaphochlamys debaryana]|eukprot:KAG2498339.1 hypothetical protein HYH03_003598 [Edaphochlamys debaryana]